MPNAHLGLQSNYPSRCTFLTFGWEGFDLSAPFLVRQISVPSANVAPQLATESMGQYEFS